MQQNQKVRIETKLNRSTQFKHKLKAIINEKCARIEELEKQLETSVVEKARLIKNFDETSHNFAVVLWLDDRFRASPKLQFL